MCTTLHHSAQECRARIESHGTCLEALYSPLLHVASEPECHADLCLCCNPHVSQCTQLATAASVQTFEQTKKLKQISVLLRVLQLGLIREDTFYKPKEALVGKSSPYWKVLPLAPLFNVRCMFPTLMLHVTYNMLQCDSGEELHQLPQYFNSTLPYSTQWSDH